MKVMVPMYKYIQHELVVMTHDNDDDNDSLSGVVSLLISLVK